MKRLGVIVNPVAGMGGRVGLKGTDGLETLRQARAMGARPESPARAVEALKVLARLRDGLEVITCPGQMGEHECSEAGFSPTVIGSIQGGDTTSEHTEQAARDMVAAGVDLILFCGGDGTARNICHAVGAQAPTLGVPAGVKIHSGVYANTPRSAGEVGAMLLGGALMNIREAEVMDIDEDAFRQGVVCAKLYGYLRVPEERRYIQCVKSGGAQVEAQALRGIAAEVVGSMDDPDCCFFIGPGTTTRAVMEALELDNTLLGIDVIRQQQLVAKDVAEAQILELIAGNTARIVVTIIGGQGHLFGRGNQQVSPQVIRAVGQENVIVIATKQKLISLSGRPLLVDTGDEALNEELSGYIKITTGWRDYVMYNVGY